MIEALYQFITLVKVLYLFGTIYFLVCHNKLVDTLIVCCWLYSSWLRANHICSKRSKDTKIMRQKLAIFHINLLTSMILIILANEVMVSLRVKTRVTLSLSSLFCRASAIDSRTKTSSSPSSSSRRSKRWTRLFRIRLFEFGVGK